MTKGHKKSLELMGMLIILPGDGSVAYPYVKTHHTAIYICTVYLYVNYTSIKLLHK